MPHLVDAAPEYQTVKGLKPNLERALTYVDIEPVSRIVMLYLHGISTVQFTYFYQTISIISIV